MIYKGPLTAPIEAGTPVAELIIHVPDLPDHRVQLVAESSCGQGRLHAAAEDGGRRALWPLSRRCSAGQPEWPGVFLSFEGIDGSGKSTQARLLAEALRARGQAVTLTREPGGSAGRRRDPPSGAGRGDRPLVSRDRDLAVHRRPARSSGKDHPPALARGDVVICDRFADSTRIFQGITRGDLAAVVDRLHDLMIGVEPDLTLLIDLEPAAGWHGPPRGRAAEMRFEDMGLAFQTRARDGFLALAAAHARFAVVDGDRAADLVAADILARVLPLVSAARGAAAGLVESPLAALPRNGLWRRSGRGGGASGGSISKGANGGLMPFPLARASCKVCAMSDALPEPDRDRGCAASARDGRG